MHSQGGKNYTFSYKKYFIKWLLFGFGICLVGVSFILSFQKNTSHEPERIWLVDTSLSMKTKDISSEKNNISRIETAKKLILSDVFDGKQALITFARTATLQLPLTTDKILFENTVSNIHIIEGAGGSDISQAIKQTLDIYADNKNANIILITDGESFDDLDISDNEIAYNNWSVIGIGTLAGGSIVEGYQSDGTPYYKMYQGQKVISRLDTTFLDLLSDKLSTSYIHLDSTENIHTIISSLPASTSHQDFSFSYGILLLGIGTLVGSFFVLPYRYFPYD